jgi:hypothetical protein
MGHPAWAPRVNGRWPIHAVLWLEWGTCLEIEAAPHPLQG